MSGLSVPPDLVKTFAHGWARTRGVAAPVADGHALRIEVDLPVEARRHVFPCPPIGIAELGRAITEPRILIKAPFDAGAVAALLPPGWHVEQTGTMMTVDHLPDADPLLPPGIGLSGEWEGQVYFVTLTDEAGEEAGRGRMTIVDGWAIHDRIRVADAHQRKGLGRAVMRALGRQARAQGATRGLLTATVAGRALYETMGWTARAPWTTAQIMP